MNVFTLRISIEGNLAAGTKHLQNMYTSGLSSFTCRNVPQKIECVDKRLHTRILAKVLLIIVNTQQEQNQE